MRGTEQTMNVRSNVEESHLVIGTSSTYRINAMKRGLGERFSKVINIAPDIDEKAYREPRAQELVTLVATKKAEAVQEKYKEMVLKHSSAASGDGNVTRPLAIIVAADQVAILGASDQSSSCSQNSHPKANVDYTAIREKPASLEENREFLRSYSNRSVITVGATVVCDVWAGLSEVELNYTETFFGPISDEVVERILQRGVSMTTCGGFVVEDEDLSKCVTHIHGTVEEVQGISIPLVESLIEKIEARREK